MDGQLFHLYGLLVHVIHLQLDEPNTELLENKTTNWWINHTKETSCCNAFSFSIESCWNVESYSSNIKDASKINLLLTKSIRVQLFICWNKSTSSTSQRMPFIQFQVCSNALKESKIFLAMFTEQLYLVQSLLCIGFNASMERPAAFSTFLLGFMCDNELSSLSNQFVLR